MFEFDCPYCNYFLSEIDSEYLETHRELNFDYSIPIYPFGEYKIKHIYDVLFVSSFLLRSYFSTEYQKHMYSAYESIICDSHSDNDSDSQSNLDLSKLKEFYIIEKLDKHSSLFSNISSKIEDCISRIMLIEGSPFPNKGTPKYRDFYCSTVMNPMENPKNNALISKVLTEIYKSKLPDLTEFEYSSLLEKCFTLLYDILIILNSITKSTEIKDLSLKIDIQEIMNYLDSTNRHPHNFDNSVIMTLEDMNKIPDIKNFYDSKLREQEHIIDNNLRFISMNYFKCLLLVTYYYAEYKDLFL